MTIQRQIGVAAGVGGLLIAASALAQRPSASPADRERIEGFLSQRQGADLQPPIADGFEPIVVVERFEPITNAPIIPGRKIEAQVTDGELVLGVVLVSFEPATSRVVLASRRAEGRTLSFARRPDGRLEDGETGSVWDPIGMEAVSGPLAGTRLTQLAGMFAFRDAWLEFHPDSEPIE